MKGKVTGIGGIFFKSRDPAALAAWYRDRLGMDVQPWGGVAFQWREDPRSENSGYSVWSPFKHDTTYFEPGRKDFMMNLRVDDLDALLAKLRSAGEQVPARREDGEFGKFGYVLDPEGNLVELWEPPAAPPNVSGT